MHTVLSTRLFAPLLYVHGAQHARTHIIIRVLLYIITLLLCALQESFGSAELPQTAKRYRRTDRPRTVRAACFVYYARGARGQVGF